MPYSGSHGVRSTNWKPGSVGSKRWKSRSESRKVAPVLASPSRRHTGGGRSRVPASRATSDANSSPSPVRSGRKVTQESRLESSATISLPQQVPDQSRRARDHEEDVALGEAALGVLEAVRRERPHAARRAVDEEPVDEARVDDAEEYA